MQEKTVSVHIIFDELVKAKIPALGERGAENNKLVLEQIALNGPLLPFDVLKSLGLKLKMYPTIHRRIMDLKNRRYLAEAGKRSTKRGEQTEKPMYGLTWRGFIASVSIEKVRKNLFQVLEKNPLLTLPEKDAIMLVLKEILTEADLETISKLFLEAYLKAIPNLEMIRDDQLWIWVFSIQNFPQLSQNVKLSKMPKDLLELLDKPAILKVIKEKIVPSIRQRKADIEGAYMLFRVLDAIGQAISKLDEKDKPSKKIREYIQKELPKMLSDKETEKVM